MKLFFVFFVTFVVLDVLRVYYLGLLPPSSFIVLTTLGGRE